MLDDVDRDRAARYHFQRDRHRFIKRRAILRILLAGRLNCDPSVLQFTCNAHGKPELHEGNLRFNASHSYGTALFTRALGCDVELCDERVDYEGIAETLFSPGEIQALGQQPPDQRRGTFFRCWTRKEAFVKAIGTGLSHPLDSFDTSQPEDAVAGWFITSFKPRPQYYAAVAAGSGVEIVLRQY